MSDLLPVPPIETERLVLRSWRKADFDRYAGLWADESTARFVGGVKDRADAWRSFASMLGHWHLRGFTAFAVAEKASGLFVGWCGPWFPEGWSEPELGWALNADMHGKGYATEAAVAARRFAYHTLGWTTAISYINAENRASRRVAEKLGAAQDGTFVLRGTPVDVWRHPSPHARPN